MSLIELDLNPMEWGMSKIITGVGLILLLVGLSMPWYTVEISTATITTNGWDLKFTFWEGNGKIIGFFSFLMMLSLLVKDKIYSKINLSIFLGTFSLIFLIMGWSTYNSINGFIEVHIEWQNQGVPIYYHDIVTGQSGDYISSSMGMGVSVFIFGAFLTLIGNGARWLSSGYEFLPNTQSIRGYMGAFSCFLVFIGCFLGWMITGWEDSPESIIQLGKWSKAGYVILFFTFILMGYFLINNDFSSSLSRYLPLLGFLIITGAGLWVILGIGEYYINGPDWGSGVYVTGLGVIALLITSIYPDNEMELKIDIPQIEQKPKKTVSTPSTTKTTMPVVKAHVPSTEEEKELVHWARHLTNGRTIEQCLNCGEYTVMNGTEDDKKFTFKCSKCDTTFKLKK
jgi:hypothetical protein